MTEFAKTPVDEKSPLVIPLPTSWPSSAVMTIVTPLLLVKLLGPWATTEQKEIKPF